MWRKALAIPGLAAVAGLAASAQPRAELSYLAEYVCEGSPAVPAAIAGRCPNARPRTADDIVAFQRHDWPAQGESDARPKGYQRSVSYAVRGPGGEALAVQTFDFGGGDRRFGAFDAGRGDGGQVVAVAPGATRIVMTEDGGGGVQWFTGSACRGETETTRSGWLLYGGARGPDWRSAVASLRITRAAGDCPLAFDQSYTRWREQAFDWPVLFDGRQDPARLELIGVATILSEHFGGASAQAADHMERFYLADRIGLIRWERWEHAERSKLPEIDRRAVRLSRSGRCPEVAGGAPPGDGWRRVDCRMWTNFVASPESALGFGWAAAIEGSR